MVRILWFGMIQRSIDIGLDAPLILVLYSVVKRADLVSHLAPKVFAVNLLGVFVFGLTPYRRRWEHFATGIVLIRRLRKALQPYCVQSNRFKPL